MNKNNKRNYYLIIGASFLLFIFFILLAYRILTGSLFGGKLEKTTQLELPEGPGFSTDLTEEEKEILDKSSLVQALVDKTPYGGANFSFYYSFDDNEFILYLNPQNQAAGNSEFDQFLKENGVESRSWIFYLKTTTTKPNPIPE